MQKLKLTQAKQEDDMFKAGAGKSGPWALHGMQNLAHGSLNTKTQITQKSFGLTLQRRPSSINTSSSKEAVPAITSEMS